MAAMNDRVINVPIADENIAKRLNSLPRTEKNSGMVNVGLKRKLPSFYSKQPTNTSLNLVLTLKKSATEGQLSNFKAIMIEKSQLFQKKLLSWETQAGMSVNYQIKTRNRPF